MGEEKNDWPLPNFSREAVVNKKSELKEEISAHTPQ